MATKIIIYTGNSCPKCKRAKEMLNNLPIGHEVELIERNVDESENSRDFLRSIIGSSSLPTIVIPKSEKGLDIFNKDTYHLYIGFDENIGKIMEHLGL
ncbi:glutaredoxin family protein [Bacillus sp. S70]|uniref:glutaredoxin family protein n=1 Tax=unclassified Bacillus (in: firmicutes) TaxID=185979 RepID=UPI00190D580F|nr:MULTISPECIES: glutaredoxin family protein [unclassified Bacillus (in: firmicutes)]MBJ9983553.1 glutaredoxin family protein [Bacillus sp. S29]MBK0104701.1 glutaredoxin family protein [Bacillus sp. S70]MBK0110047.1 glutaredoxin family protein [Bacillus sp. S73]MBK0138828.1 glutaredoxin family protein [Bacillus sp. S72]MBK0148018.1 glutaredoxin family protein [Bacillus sp. S74]